MRNGSLFLTILALAGVGCGASTGEPATEGPGAAPSPTAVPSATLALPSAPRRPPCPNPDGGSSNHCLGSIQAGTYQTEMFTPTVRYTVPGGWSNFEDLPGNFLLIPPGGSLDGIADGSSDYIGVYSGVAIAEDDDCVEVPEVGVGRNAAAMADALATRPGLDVAEPQPVTIGGRSGVAVDVDLADDWEGDCPFALGVPAVPLIIGTGPAALHHVQIHGATARFYFLDGVPTNVAIEVNDGPDQANRDAYESVIWAFEFTAGD